MLQHKYRNAISIKCINISAKWISVFIIGIFVCYCCTHYNARSNCSHLINQNDVLSAIQRWTLTIDNNIFNALCETDGLVKSISNSTIQFRRPIVLYLFDTNDIHKDITSYGIGSGLNFLIVSICMFEVMSKRTNVYASFSVCQDLFETEVLCLIWHMHIYSYIEMMFQLFILMLMV